MAGTRPSQYPTRPPQNQARPWQNFPRNRVTNPQSHFNASPSNNGSLGYQNPSSSAVLSNRFYAPPPPPPRPPAPPQPFSFIRPNYSEPPLPPGTTESPLISTLDGRSLGFAPPPPPPRPPVMNPDGTFAPLIPPPLPPLFPYLSATLAQSLHDGATQCGTSFVEESNDLPFIPVIIDDNDLKKMTESVKTQFEETRQQNLLLYEDIIDPTWPKELRAMFQPLYCKLCKLTLSSPVVARDHYKGRRHVRAGEVWIQENSHRFKGPQLLNNSRQNNTNNGPISGTIKQVAGRQSNRPPFASQAQQQKPFRGNNNGPSSSFYQNQHGFDRSPAPPPPPPYNNNHNQNSSFKRNIQGGRVDQQNPEFIPAYRAALAGGPPARKKPKKEGGGGPNFAFCGLCNVHHTSAVTAEQHYSGKNHKAKLAAHQNGEKNSNPPYADDSCYGNFASPRVAGNQISVPANNGGVR